MKIVTDRGSDLTPGQMEGIEVHFAPMRLTLDGKTYNSGVDITPEAFYALLDRTEGFPTTSQATAGEFAALYKQLAVEDPDIFSLHISGGLSGTLDSAHAGAEMVPEARVKFWDTKYLSCGEGWQVEVAARMLQAGLDLEQVMARLTELRAATVSMFTLDTLKYLIHGGRISHLKGMVASLLQLRPIITVDQETGKYVPLGQERSMKRAVTRMAELIAKVHPVGSALRMQIMHGNNPTMVEQLRETLAGMFQCHWLPIVSVAPVLGAHTGGSVIGVAAAPIHLFNIS
jgi:DegV family protein with EDD domain